MVNRSGRGLQQIVGTLKQTHYTSKNGCENSCVNPLIALHFPEDRAFEVKQWETSTFMWKIERFFYDQPQMFLEPSGISDSGAFSQSTFSELQSEEDKGNYQFVVVVVGVVVVASLNNTYSCTSPWWSCMTNNKCNISLCRN